MRRYGFEDLSSAANTLSNAAADAGGACFSGEVT
jgi:hypothetical protein